MRPTLRRSLLAFLLAAAGYAAEWLALGWVHEAHRTLTDALLFQIVWNGLALGAYLFRAREGGTGARGFRVGACAFGVLVLSNVAGVLARNGSREAAVASVAFLVLGALVQAAGILLWPWRRVNVNRAASAIGAAVFTASVLVLFWGFGSWSADRGREPFFSSVQLGLGVRQAILSSVAVYLLLESPRRWRGMLGWITVGAVGSGLVLTSFQMFLGSGRVVSSLVSAAVGLLPLLMAAGAWSGAGLETEVAPADRRWLLLVFVPFVVSGATLAAAHLMQPNPLGLATLGFVLIAGGVVAVAGLLVRELGAGQRHLEARVDDRTWELEQAMVALVRSQRLSVVATLAASAVHDLRNLLGVVRSQAAVLREELAVVGSPSTREGAADLCEAADRAADLVGHLLGYLRDETEPAVFLDLGAALREEERVLRAVVPRSIDFHLELPEGAALTRASQRRVAQILLNLLANACEALGGRGHIAVRLASAPPRGWSLQVEDDGPGMPPEIVAHLFEPLRTTRAREGGTGLGLTSVKALAEQDGALVAVRSAPGRGTAVSVIYPAAVQAREDPTAGPPGLSP